jgi:hypothetical protein
VKKIFAVLVFLILANLGIEVYDYFKVFSRAVGAYQDQATLMAHSRRREPPFDSIEGGIVDVSYSLESFERIEDGTVHLVAVQAVHFAKGSPLGNGGGRRIARTRHHVQMIKVGRRWQISRLEQDASEIGEPEGALRDSGSSAP